MKSKVYIETFGCQMNVADTERAATGLRRAGYEVTASAEAADVVLLNTCSVRERAERNYVGRLCGSSHFVARSSQTCGSSFRICNVHLATKRLDVNFGFHLPRKRKLSVCGFPLQEHSKLLNTPAN